MRRMSGRKRRAIDVDAPSCSVATYVLPRRSLPLTTPLPSSGASPSATGASPALKNSFSPMSRASSSTASRSSNTVLNAFTTSARSRSLGDDWQTMQIARCPLGGGSQVAWGS